MLLRPYSSQDGERGFTVRCPGCSLLDFYTGIHVIRIARDPRYPKDPIWDYNNNSECPTFGPSVRVIYGGTPGVKDCHFFIENGRFKFCSDSFHWRKLLERFGPIAPDGHIYAPMIRFRFGEDGYVLPEEKD